MAAARLFMRHLLSDGTYTNSFLAVLPCQCSGLVPSRRPLCQIAAVTVHAKPRVRDMQAVPATASGTVARTHCTALDSICAQVTLGEMASGMSQFRNSFAGVPGLQYCSCGPKDVNISMPSNTI
jgi:hypothetical protein